MNQPPALPLSALQGAVPDRVRHGRLFCLAELEGDEGLKVGALRCDSSLCNGRGRWCYSDCVVTDAGLEVPLPDELSFECAMALMIQGLTALYLTKELEPNEVDPDQRGRWRSGIVAYATGKASRRIKDSYCRDKLRRQKPIYQITRR